MDLPVKSFAIGHGQTRRNFCQAKEDGLEKLWGERGVRQVLNGRNVSTLRLFCLVTRTFVILDQICQSTYLERTQEEEGNAPKCTPMKILSLVKSWAIEWMIRFDFCDYFWNKGRSLQSSGRLPPSSLHQAFDTPLACHRQSLNTAQRNV